MRADPSRRPRFELVDGPLPPNAPPTRDVAPGRPARAVVAVVLAAMLVIVVAATVLPRRVGDGAIPPPVGPPPPAPSTVGPTPGCDLADAGCRIVTAERWRARTAAVLRERLDPDDAYFNGYSYAVSSRYNTGPRLNALGLDVYRLEGGGTEVFIQIAKTRDDAIRCGEITHHRCAGQRFMDGNRFSMTATTTVAEGIEVQHSPTGVYVITVVARNTTRGRALQLSTGDLIAVAQDPRLEPPS